MLNKKKLNILIVNYEYPPIGGGGGVICKDIAEELVILGHKVTVVTSFFNSLKKDEFVNGVRVLRVPVLFRKKMNTASIFSMLSYVPECIKCALRESEKIKFDIVHTHFAIPSGPAGHYISKKLNIPNILSIHGGDIYDPSKKLSPHKSLGLKQTVGKMLNSAEKVVAQSTDTKNNAINYYNISRSIEIIPLGIKEVSKIETSKEKLNIPNDCFVFSTIGRLVKRKNILELLKVIKKVNEVFPCKLLIMGDGPEKETIVDNVKLLGLNNVVHVLGRVTEEEKNEYLSISDIYLSTAMHEGFGIVFLEAMKFGLPVICYDKGGQIDFLKNNITGNLVQLNDLNDFINSVIRLLKDSQKMKEISKHNTEYIKEFYIRNIATKYEKLFFDVLN